MSCGGECEEINFIVQLVIFAINLPVLPLLRLVRLIFPAQIREC